MERRGRIMNRWHLGKRAVNQWSRVKREMKIWEWASAGVRVPCIPWAANLAVSPFSPRPASLVWKAAALAAEYYNSAADRVGVRFARWKYIQHKHTPSSLLLTQCLSYELCWIRFGSKMIKRKQKNSTASTAYLFGKRSSLWIRLIHHVIFSLLHATVCSPLLLCTVSKLIRLRSFYFSRIVFRCSAMCKM